MHPDTCLLPVTSLVPGASEVKLRPSLVGSECLELTTCEKEVPAESTLGAAEGDRTLLPTQGRVLHWGLKTLGDGQLEPDSRTVSFHSPTGHRSGHPKIPSGALFPGSVLGSRLAS